MIWIFLILVSYAMSRYSTLILGYANSWDTLPPNDESTKTNGSVTVTVLVPARNEEKNINKCLEGILAQHYPNDLLRIVVINDHSDDQTEEVAATIAADHKNVSVLSLSESEAGKKTAIEKGIRATESELIITTDADCVHGPDWINTITSIYDREQPDMILAPVLFHKKNSWLNRVLSLEFLALMASTGATAQQNNPNMCNGANLCYTRKAFHDVNGFEGIDGTPSGDDVFLMLKIHNNRPGSVRFSKAISAIVRTDAPETIGQFWQQRKRWLSKRPDYNNPSIKQAAYTVYFGNVIMLISLILIWPSRSFDWICIVPILFVLAKILIDRILLKKAGNDLGVEFSWVELFISELFLSVYIPLIGLIGNSGTFVWKGRKSKDHV